MPETTANKPWVFTLQQLFAVTFVLLPFVFLFRDVSAFVLLGLLISVVFLLGPVFYVLATSQERLRLTRVGFATPFWQCIAAWALFLFNSYVGLFSKYSILYSWWSPSVSGRRWRPFASGYRWWMRDAEHIVMYSFLLGSIFLLIFSVLRRGQRLTQLFAFLLLVFLASELYAINAGPWVSLSDAIEYWTTGGS